MAHRLWWRTARSARIETSVRSFRAVSVTLSGFRGISEREPKRTVARANVDFEPSRRPAASRPGPCVPYPSAKKGRILFAPSVVVSLRGSHDQPDCNEDEHRISHGMRNRLYHLRKPRPDLVPIDRCRELSPVEFHREQHRGHDR